MTRSAATSEVSRLMTGMYAFTVIENRRSLVYVESNVAGMVMKNLYSPTRHEAGF
jgi:hypothetical protein